MNGHRDYEADFRQDLGPLLDTIDQRTYEEWFAEYIREVGDMEAHIENLNMYRDWR